MRRRIYLAAVVVLALASVAVATFVAVQRTRPQAGQRATTTQKGATPKSAAAQSGTPATAQSPIRPADPNRAPQNLVDEALYTNEEFFGTQASVARPYAAALERVSALETQYPKDARLKLSASRLAERLGQFDRAATEMTQYADLKRRSPDALRRLAQFYHNRARFADEVKTLTELARALPVNDRAPVYKRAAGLVRTYALSAYRPADFFAELVAADSSNVQPVKDYVDELRLANQNREALSVLSQYQSKFPEDLAYFLKTRAAVLESQNDRRAAEEVYSSAFDPNWSRKIAADYYDLLRRFGRYRVARRTLQERVKGGATDLDTNARLFRFLAYENNYTQAASVLRQLEERRAGRATSTPTGTTPQPVRASAWNANELRQAAAMYASIGHFDQSSRYLYTLYLLGQMQPQSASREDALYRLFKVMIDAEGTPTRVGTGDLSFYRDVAEVDRHPGFMNGVLSLVLSGEQPAAEFATQEKAAAGYFNRAFAYRIFNAYRLEFPQSKNLGEMYLGVINVFAAMGEHKLAVEVGREFQQKFPDSPSFVDVTLRMADSQVALDNRTGERALLLPLLDRLAKSRPRGTPLVASSAKRWAYTISPTIDAIFDKIKYNVEAYSDTYEPSGDEDSSSDESEDYVDEESDYSESSSNASSKSATTYSSVLERYVSSLATEEKKQETVNFFWGQIRKYPREEGLYERFLRWLGQAELINEQLKAYNSAIRQFDSNTWYHRMARWYVRQKRGRELQQYARQLINVFDEEEISDYLYRFAGYGASATGDQLDWDQKLAYDLYSHAHNRFPRNLFFVRGMLTYLWHSANYTEWERLSRQYYFADRSIREPYLAWLSKQNQLRERYQQAAGRGNAAAQTQTTRGVDSRFAYQVFAADSALWLSHHDEALDAYRQLNSFYPGETQYAERLADLTRSFGQQSNALYEESAKTLEKMAEVYPTSHDYRIKAGEVYAQLGDFKRAAEQWDKLTKLEPGERETYLEVATVFWDYYQYDDALRIFRDLRQTTGEPDIYAYRMGAVYEGKGDWDSAIAEYVKVLDEPGDGRDTVARRLAQLSRRPGLNDKIVAAYNQTRSANQNNWQQVIGYATYLAESDRQADALAMLRTEVERSSDIAFLETVRDLFHAILRPEDEQQVIARLAAVARDEREAMMYRLQLASFLERKNKVDDAIAIVDRLVAEYPTNVGVVEESAKFYWRAGLVDRSLDLYRNTLARAQGANRRTITLQLARRQVEADRYDAAEATLRAYYNENRQDAEVFTELAKTLGAANKLEALTELYKEGLKDAREAGGDESRTRVADLRDGMIQTFDRLGKYQDAVDQYIEIVNTYPEDADRLATAMDYAEKRNLTDRLTAYYEKLTKEAFKNYRWQLVLGRMYERLGNVAGASEQYRLAVINEPARSDLRFALASTLTRQRRYDEAIAVLQEGWNRSGRDSSWLVEVARIQVSQGKRGEAAQTIRQALAAKKNPKTEDEFDMASKLASWGLHGDAVRMYEATFQRLPRVLKDEYVNSEHVRGYVRSLIRVEPAAATFQKLQIMRGQYAAISANSKDTDASRARSVVDAVDSALRSDFGRGVLDFADGRETAALASALLAATQQLTLYTDKDALLRYSTIAHEAGLFDVEEQLLTRIKDAAFKARTRVDDFKPYTELGNLIKFYERRAAFTRAAEVLAAQFAADPHKERHDYQNQIATEYRLAGDRDRELASLRAAYASLSGAVMESELEWVGRYFSLLYSSGMRDELQRLASTPSTAQYQLINFLIEKGERELARTAIANARQTPAWKASRSAEVGLFVKDNSPATENFFKAALDYRTIGQTLNRRVDADQILVGDDWFVAARNYGYWLGNAGRDAESRRFTPAEIEGDPVSGDVQLELAAFYLDRKDTTRALNHVQLAAELAPGETDVALMRGAVLLAQGDRQGALAAWNAVMSGRVTSDNAERYLRMAASNGMLREALPQVENFIIAYLNRRSRRNDYDERVENVKPLIRLMSETADARTATAVASTFENILRGAPNDLLIGKLIIEEKLLPAAALSGIYRTLHQRYTELAVSTFGTPEYEDGLTFNGAFVNPGRDLSEFRRDYIDYLVRSNSLAEARLLIESIKREDAENDLALEDQATGDDEEQSVTDYYEWLPLALALVELRMGRDATKVVAELRSYCGLDEPTQTTGGDGDEESYDETASQGTLHEHCLKAYALLIAERRDKEAEDLLYDAYREAARGRYASDASLAGLAEIEARRGRSAEATRLLKLVVERSTDNLRALRLAAETAAKIGAFAQAVEYREQIAGVNPDDAVNQIELVRALSAAGRNGEATDRIIALVNERTTPNTARAILAEIVGVIATVDRAAAEKIRRLSQNTATQDGAGALLSLAALEESAGNLDAAQSALSRVQGPLEPLALTKAGTLFRRANRDGDAVRVLERALYLDPDADITDVVAFRVSGTRAQLITLYSRQQRDHAAIRLTEGEGKTPLSAAARKVLAGESDGEGEEADSGVVFEPSITTPRDSAPKLKTIAELNEEARNALQGELVAALAESSARLGRLDRAIALARLRVQEVKRDDERTAIERRIAEFAALIRAREAQTATLLRVNKTNATQWIYSSRLLGN